MRYYGMTDQGRVRPMNQDAIYYGEKDGMVLACVCDGMGGHQAGEVASTLAINCVKESFLNIEGFVHDGDVRGWLVDTISDANTKVYEEALANPEYQGMGTTIVLALWIKDTLFIGSIGDSRLYIYKDAMKQVTVDDTFVNMLVENGTITREQSRYHAQRNVLLKAVGVEEEVETNIYVTKCEAGKILLCSDGLYNEILDEEMAVVLQEDCSVKEKVERLVFNANHHGGRDNISVIIVEKDGDVHE